MNKDNLTVGELNDILYSLSEHLYKTHERTGNLTKLRETEKLYNITIELLRTKIKKELHII